MGFAPLWIPISRRMQTFGVIVGVWLGFLGHASGALFWLYMFFTPLWPISVGYATLVILFDSDRSSRGGRRIEFIRHWKLWKYFCDYFPVTLVKTAYLDRKRNYIFGFHPHGIIGAGAFANFATEGSGFSKKFPGIKPHVMTLKSKLNLISSI